MSTLLLNTLTGKTSAGSIVVTGEGGSTTTNLQQGVAKAWVDATNAAVLTDSFNLACGTDNGTGDYTYAITNDMASVNYSAVANAEELAIACKKGQTAGTYNIRLFGRADSIANEDKENFFAIFGDLA